MRIFIASSGERLNMAIEVGSWLEGMNVEPVLWNEPEVFPLGAYTWDALIDLSENVDAAIFIFGEDDQIWFRGESTMTVRDNVTSISLIGGEPTIHPQFVKILRKLEKQEVHLFTNKLCNALDISIMDLLDDEDMPENTTELNTKEREIISTYRKYSRSKKEMLGTYMKMLEQFEEI